MVKMADDHDKPEGRQNDLKTVDSESSAQAGTPLPNVNPPKDHCPSNRLDSGPNSSTENGEKAPEMGRQNPQLTHRQRKQNQSFLCTRHHYKNISEYTNSCRTWLWQNQYLQYCNQANAFQNSMVPFYTMSLMASMSAPTAQQQSPYPSNGGSFGSSIAGQQPSVFNANNNVAANQQPAAGAAAAAGTVYRIPPIWKRVVAEFIDFILLLLIKVGVTCVLVDITGSISGLTFDEMIAKLKVPRYSLPFFAESQAPVKIDDISLMLSWVFLYRNIVVLFEAMCLRHGVNMVGGSTPGKRLMGLCVVSCIDVQELGESTIRVIPAENIGFWNALVRSVIKNFSLAFLFPLCLTAIAFQHGRAVYDILANSVVVEANINNNNANQRQQ
ncbi:uncharacterized protein LOC141910129 isoform X2 [Tubulanus polymorphus]|uniref:uncharacterized protein LOC141910129 isoform X2 n=1 Tax=Tubulanus polymorphus TaxID=672921 RepID=UPI003DA3EFCA